MRATRWAEQAIDSVVAATMLLIAALVFIQFASRYVLNFSLSWSEEVATFAMIWGGLLGLVSYLRDGRLIGIDPFASVRYRGFRLLTQGVAQGATAAFLLIVLWLGINMSVFSRSTGVSSAAEIPLRWIYLIYPVLALGALARLAQRGVVVYRGHAPGPARDER